MVSIIILGKNISRLWVIVIVLILLATAGLLLFTRPESPENPNKQTDQSLMPGYFKVVRVIDGDTIEAYIDNKVETIRLIGIDAPELPSDCFADISASKAREILQGQPIRLKPDESQDNRDRYGRLLRYVFLEDGTNFNRLMISRGYAREYTFITPYTFQTKFKKAQSKAKKNKLGLWSAC